ncbi:hypothetical protein C8J57DRAFT_1214156 [Mycena rebaudengoi]|nr:hypothetical protein C8J57DRAFT_1214156 [Mycena rebaudengoi]
MPAYLAPKEEAMLDVLVQDEDRALAAQWLHGGKGPLVTQLVSIGVTTPPESLTHVSCGSGLDFGFKLRPTAQDSEGHSESAVVAAGYRSTAAGNRWIAAASAAAMSHRRSVTLPVATNPLALPQTAADRL